MDLSLNFILCVPFFSKQFVISGTGAILVEKIATVKTVSLILQQDRLTSKVSYSVCVL